ncbi:MBL fold metallo-hydrolase [Erwinia sp. INIA-01]|uniref:MBL fold metallo-hydrolase n=1 Tax=Erwinia sp. INIA01 TaxID=2991500 RepID=UPI00222464C3|nr:MBL fold metallo-hydrolase [Erwinia sp. INIA01]MCW1876409.1 MBL fold metallo-hydrolase [Erwinia sp. INIA01]
MKLTQIRNATLKLDYAGKTFLIDPMLADKGALPGFPGTARSHLRNPLVELPLPVADIINADAVIVTHTHEDHWDEAARRLIASTIPLFSQNQQDAEQIRAQGFSAVTVLDDRTEIGDITVWKTDGQHGSNAAYALPPLAKRLGKACGLVFQHPEEPTLYIAGDTVWVPAVEQALAAFKPDVVVLNAGSAQIDCFGAIIMGEEDALRVHRLLPESHIIASHMEAINHCLLGRQQLRDYAQRNGFAHRLWVAEDGESRAF